MDAATFKLRLDTVSHHALLYALANLPNAGILLFKALIPEMGNGR